MINTLFDTEIIYIDLHLFDEVMNNLASEGLQNEVNKEWWDTKLIHLNKKKLYYNQFGDKYNIPSGNGRTVEMRIMQPSAPALTPLTDGVIPDGELIDVDKVTCTVKQYGTYKKITDMVEWTACDPLTDAIHKENARQAAVTLDIITREELMGGTNVFYAPKVNGDTVTDVKSRADLTKDCRLTPDMLFEVQALLSSNDAETFEGDAFVGIIHPRVAFDIVSDKDNFIDVVKYAASERIFAGEIGKYAGVRFVKSTNAKIFYPNDIVKGKCRFTVKADGSSSTSIPVNEAITAEQAAAFTAVDVYINGVANKVTAVTAGAAGAASLTVQNAVAVTAGQLICGQGAGKDGSAVYGTVILGRHAYGTTRLEEGGLEFITKSKEEAGGPIEQFSTAGWKATAAAVRLQEAYMIRVESANKFSANLTSQY